MKDEKIPYRMEENICKQDEKIPYRMEDEKMKRYLTEWKKIFANNVTDKSLISKIYKKPRELKYFKKTINPFSLKLPSHPGCHNSEQSSTCYK